MMDSIVQQVEEKTARARDAATATALLSTEVKNRALRHMARALIARKDFILEFNAEDVEAGRQNGLSDALIDRLQLTESRIEDICEGLRQVESLEDPIGRVIQEMTRPNGLRIQKVRVPFGVVGIIYESRPNVTVDSVALCMKAGNVTVLKGGSEALKSNAALTTVIADAASEEGVPADAIQLIDTPDRAAAQHMMKLNRHIDVLVPRGGAGLIQAVVKNATVPVIETGVGNCHVYVDDAADLRLAEDIAFNSKVQRPSVCNAAETLLVHQDIAADFLPKLADRLMDAGVELRGCERTRALVAGVRSATDEDWDTEFLALVLAVKVVDDLEDAIKHINRHGTMHSEAIVTRNNHNIQQFIKEVDAAAVYANASTRFTDGFEFGLGAEIGISTQKLHARGPMGLEELTSYKWVVQGTGQVRG